MELLYRIINFSILAVIILVIFGKGLIKKFRERRETIEKALDEAERIEKEPLPVFDDAPDTPKVTVIEPQDEAQEKIDAISLLCEREKREIRRNTLKKLRRTVFLKISESVTELYRNEPYKSKGRALEPMLVDMILEKIKLTPGDMAYLKRHDVLYVTLTSAYPLDRELVDKVDRATTELLQSVGGKTSLWVLEDESLISGLKLRIGDTVYDCTVAEELYRFGKSIRRDVNSVNMLRDDVFKKLEDYNPKLRTYQLGRVMTVSDGICWMDGLADIMYGEVVEFDCGEQGMVLDIQPDRIGCVIFGEYEHIESGSRVRRVGNIAKVPVGDVMLGRVVDAIGFPIDGDDYITFDEYRPIENAAPEILDREAVSRPLHTGIKAIDALVPIGRGQRELIIGDRQTGKTAIALDAIINQKGKNTVCIYVAIGQKDTSIFEVREKLAHYGAMEYTTIVAAPASGSAALQYLAPFAGAAMAEHFMENGRDVLIVYDDLSKHAVAYRELSLLLHRPSGREAYPGDIFYLHSRLLERSAQLSKEKGGGSVTALPIVETLAGDISAYIPTNVISITDGQIFLESELFYEGQRPAVNVGLSVSRVGSSAQTKLMKQVSGNLRAKLAQYRELADFTQFGTDVDDTTKQTLDAGRRLTEILRQDRYAPLEDWKQALIIFAVSEGFAKTVPIEFLHDFEIALYTYFETECQDFVEVLRSGAKMSAEFIAELKAQLTEFCKRL